jgi:hypothetical protein
MSYTKESFEEVLQQAYDMLEPEDIKELLMLVDANLCIEGYQNEFIHSVFNNVLKFRNISFKQWKALSAYVDEKRREEKHKNNKTF